MTGSSRPSPSSLSGRDRMFLAMLGIGLLLPFVVGAALRPDPRGHGTHEQLGLPPCTFHVLFGRRCPSCGMTTAFAHFVRGEVVEALQANVGGTIVALVLLLAGPWSLLAAARGKWLGPPPDGTAVSSGLMVIVLITLIDWALRELVGY